MKFLAVAIAVLATTGCTQAQQAPVNIAMELYTSCLIGFTQARDLPKSDADIKAQSIEIDANCTLWTYVWLPAFLNKGRPYLTLAEDIRFKQRKSALIAAYANELKLMSSR